MAASEENHETFEYAKWLRDRIKSHVDAARAFVPHRGESGRVAEGAVATALREFLPKRFSLGTGFIVNAKGETSSQIDIVVYDNEQNAPILFEGGVGIFPIECVYGIVAVTRKLDVDKLKESLSAIERIRRMAVAKNYVTYSRSPGTPVEHAPKFQPLSPRSFIFAVAKNKGMDVRQIQNLLHEEFKDSFVHGLISLTPPWFCSQIAYDRSHAVEAEVSAEEAFKRFLIALRHDLPSMPIAAGNFEPYFSAPRTVGL